MSQGRKCRERVYRSGSPGRGIIRGRRGPGSPAPDEQVNRNPATLRSEKELAEGAKAGVWIVHLER